MAGLLIVYHSMTGGTAALARAAHDAASAEGPSRLLEARHAGPDDILCADGYLFACPENLAAIAGMMKDFFDRSYYAVLGRIEGRGYGQIVCAGNDGRNAAAQTARIATGWRLKAVQEPLIVRTGAETAAAILAPKTIDAPDLEKARALGGALGAGLALGVF